MELLITSLIITSSSITVSMCISNKIQAQYIYSLLSTAIHLNSQLISAVVINVTTSSVSPPCGTIQLGQHVHTP